MNKFHWMTLGATALLLTTAVYVTLDGTGWDSGNEGESFNYLTTPVAKTSDQTEFSRKLVEYTKTEFLTREVLKVGDNIYVAIGWALANVIMIEGEDGIIIVDTTESTTSMEEIMVGFRKITIKPVTAIILTHSHPDHIHGIDYIVEEEKKVHPNISIDIYSHELTKKQMSAYSYFGAISLKRAFRQFGVMLPKDADGRTGAGIGPELRVDSSSGLHNRIPTVTFTDRASYNLSGVQVDLIHTPGETKDQIAVWLKKERAVLPGDNIYKTFPNLYAIRGGPARDAKQWYTSLDKIRKLGGQYLVGSHTRPVEGAKAVYDTLLIYRDAIKYVHDQTVRLLNKGYFPGEIVEGVKLPDKLARYPKLQEYYGSVAWSVRGVFTNYLGWFSGNPRDLHPMTESDRAARMLRLIAYAQTRKAHPVEVMLQEAQISHMNSYNHYRLTGKHILSDDKWALELADAVLATDGISQNFTHIARQIKVSALRSIGVEQISANGRNYYLTYAMEVEYNIRIERGKASRAYHIKTLPADWILELQCSKVMGLACQYYNYTIGYTFTDVGRSYAQTLRNSVCDVFESPSISIVPQVELSTTSDTFKSIHADDLDLDAGVNSGSVEVVKGTLDTYKAFLNCFDPVNSA